MRFVILMTSVISLFGVLMVLFNHFGYGVAGCICGGIAIFLFVRGDSFEREK